MNDMVECLVDAESQIEWSSDLDYLAFSINFRAEV